MSSLNNSTYYQSLPTAGAVAVTNDKGERTMQKVKVQRYITGRKPRYADDDDRRMSSESESSDESDVELTANYRKISAANSRKDQQYMDFQSDIKTEDMEEEDILIPTDDRRLRRLAQRSVKTEDEDDEETDRRHVRRHVLQPQILEIGSEAMDREVTEEPKRRRGRREVEDESNDEEMDDENVEQRHEAIRMRKEIEEVELLDKDDDEDDDEEEESEYEEYTDSEDETGPRLKPVFVRKKERMTVMEKDKEEQRERQQKEMEKRAAEERKRQTLKMIEEDIRREELEKEEQKEEEAIKQGIISVLTDDEDDETAYEIWKLRELKRVKRDKDESDSFVREQQEVERLRNMTEEERLEELKKNPKVVTNAQQKGKYKFLQKYYHRGVFFLDKEDEVFTRDFAQPTLEDHFDRTVLPQVMQVKNFGRSGRTKYTHLVDQDTTAFDGGWNQETTQSSKFYSQHAAGMRQVFDRPSGSRRKK
ncbi:microfibrillar-associated protein 1-like [Oppia nitens]|uniref:microfibrillar-associated protein 1-like n=1 Tax=Oppia nitens TaxID=1686743 RepID=UPI0023DB929E|nr:microfibrillar-associated protein 1-like [Oppia nitens]